jgi:hypothetical protein
VWFVDELPKGPTGKILKREIAQRSLVVGGVAELPHLPGRRARRPVSSDGRDDRPSWWSYQPSESS